MMVIEMSDKVYVVGHKSPDTDSICSAISYARLKNLLGEDNVVAARAGEVNNETRFVLDRFDLDDPELIEDAAGKEIILVDHNEVSQAVDNIEDAEVIEVLDHHRIGDVQTGNPIFFLVKPVGCTATIVAQKYGEYDVEVPNDVAGALLSSIISDTVLFKSPTSTETDQEIANKLASQLGLDVEDYGVEVLKAKSDIGSKTPADIVTGDYKEFDFAGAKIGIGQAEVMDASEVLAMKDDLLQVMQDKMNSEGYDMITLMVTDVLKEGSELLFVGTPYAQEKFEEAFGGKVEDSSLWIDGVMSRKKQVVPPLEEAFTE